MRRLQNKIAESRMTLSLVSILGALLAVAYGAFGLQLGNLVFSNAGWWVQVALIALSTMLMVELNNSNSLIRIYSRMVSCSFLLLTLMALPVSDASVATFAPVSLSAFQPSLVALSFIVFYLFFLQAYQDQTAVGMIYGAFFALGVGSMFFVHLFYFVPLFWLLMGIRLNAMGWRTFFASLLGLITPYWLIGGWFLYQQDYLTPLNHFMSLAQFVPLHEVFSLQGQHAAPFFTEPELLLTLHGSVLAPVFTLLFVLLLTFTGIIHFLRQSSNDKLRTQMIYELFIFVTLAIILFYVLQPQHYVFLLRMLIVNTATLIGHFLALTRTKTTNIAFFVILALTLVLTGYNIFFS